MVRIVLLAVVASLFVALVRAFFRPPPRHLGMGASPDRWDPWAVLGVGRGASPAALAEAYHARLKEYHPDRVAGLGPELQALAHQKTIDIQRAYAELSGS